MTIMNVSLRACYNPCCGGCACRPIANRYKMNVERGKAKGGKEGERDKGRVRERGDREREREIFVPEIRL